ncbi:MAG: Fic family protein [Gammaproteobacteria bacterium]|nr:Fic family protein [Gammaproteobacteria bacterium]
MKKPISPPKAILPSSLPSKKMHAIFNLLQAKQIESTYKGEYLHWEDLKHRPRPEGLSNEEFWFAVKIARRNSNFTNIPFKGIDDRPFWFTIPTCLFPKLSIIDRKSGMLHSNTPAYNQEKYLLDSLTEEAISSSQLEGAATTRRIAKEMLLSERKPHNNDERMILNNYYAMQFIRDNKSKTLSLEFILEIHRIISKDTLESSEYEGAIRTHDKIDVIDTYYNEILYTPPQAKFLDKQIQKLCDFANIDESEEQHYIHPIIKAIILHFMLAYLHPFEDGNGRTARALFYWFLLKRGYSSMEFISISNIIKKAPIQYGNAFLYTETDDNDLTYFIFHQIKVILQAIEALDEYVERQKEELKEVEKLLQNTKHLNHRQLAIIQHALKNPGTEYSIIRHQKSHNITYETARTDLLKLAGLGLFSKKQFSKAFTFHAHADLKTKLKKVK